jgi:hypothetical protein
MISSHEKEYDDSVSQPNAMILCYFKNIKNKIVIKVVLLLVIFLDSEKTCSSLHLTLRI